MTNVGARVPIFGGIPSRRKVKDIVSVGTIIKEVLKKKEMSIKTLSQKSEIKDYIISKIINNVRKIDSKTAEKLEEVLELDPQSLMKADRKFRSWLLQESVKKDDGYEDDIESSERTKPTFKSERETELEYKNFHRSMREHIGRLMVGNLNYILISLSDTYAVIAKVVTLDIKKYIETTFQSLDQCITKDFCIMTIFEWGKGLPEDSPLNNLGCAIKQIYTTGEVEKRLQEIGSV